MNWAREYLKQIKAERIAVSAEVRRVYERLEEQRRDKEFPFKFDERTGEHPIDFIETFCRHYEGELAGQRVQLDLWQKAFVQSLFGWTERRTGVRRFREFLLLVGRKNGKSMLSACIMVYMLVADGEAGAQCVSIATKYDQAAIVYKTARKIIEQDANLRALVKPIIGGMEFKLTSSVMKALASKSKTLDGLNLHYVSCDELHAQEDRNMYDVTRQGQGARRQPIFGSITTAGFAREGIYDEIFDYAHGVAIGINNDLRFLPILYKLDSRAEWKNPDCWEKANPGLGTIKSRQLLADDVEKAKRSPAYLPTVLVKDFDVQENAAATWLTYETAVNESTVSMDYLRRSYAVGGCDLSATTDLTCATMLIKKPNDLNFYVLQQYFLPRNRIDEADSFSKKEAPYKLWAEQGWLTVCDGSIVDFHAVTEWFIDMGKTYNIRPLWIGYDRALSGYWVPDMEKHGFKLERIAQGSYTWTYPMKLMQGAFEEHRVIYQNNPMLRWCLTNTAKESKNKDGIESIRPVKISARRRIDGTVSLLNAWTCLNNNEERYNFYVR